MNTEHIEAANTIIDPAMDNLRNHPNARLWSCPCGRWYSDAGPGPEPACPYCTLQKIAELPDRDECGDPIHLAEARDIARSAIGLEPLPLSAKIIPRGPRPTKREDGTPTRRDQNYWTPAEWAIHRAMEAVEAAGAGPSLTDAVVLLGQAQQRVADFYEEADSRPAPSAPSDETWLTWLCDTCGRQVDRLYAWCDVCSPERKNEQRCPVCGGGGNGPLGADTCGRCKGEGFIDVSAVGPGMDDVVPTPEAEDKSVITGQTVPDATPVAPKALCGRCGHEYLTHVFGHCDVSRGGVLVCDCPVFVRPDEMTEPAPDVGADCSGCIDPSMSHSCETGSIAVPTDVERAVLPDQRSFMERLEAVIREAHEENGGSYANLEAQYVWDHLLLDSFTRVIEALRKEVSSAGTTVLLNQLRSEHHYRLYFTYDTKLSQAAAVARHRHEYPDCPICTMLLSGVSQGDGS